MPMKTLRSSQLVIALLLLAFFPTTVIAQEAPTISVRTEPATDQIVPDKDLVKTIIEIKDGQGQLTKNIVIDFQVDSPAPSSWISTDFPMVEGTRLHQSRFDAPDGMLELKFVWPIRGDYKLIMRASPAPGTNTSFAPITKQLTMHINENPSEGRNLLQFVIGLGILGLVAGMIMGAGHRAGQPG